MSTRLGQYRPASGVLSILGITALPSLVVSPRLRCIFTQRCIYTAVCVVRCVCYTVRVRRIGQCSPYTRSAARLPVQSQRYCLVPLVHTVAKRHGKRAGSERTRHVHKSDVLRLSTGNSATCYGYGNSTHNRNNHHNKRQHRLGHLLCSASATTASATTASATHCYPPHCTLHHRTDHTPSSSIAAD